MVMVMTFVVGAFGRVPNNMEKELDELEIR